ncbi:DUF3604 domain-containing protein [Planctomycetota bacterium]|nr:DUF3604 domain-containing protein [Planctomycetota bacterium]
MLNHKLYWGDLHSHCAISYGHGTVEQAIARAAQQLDFCSVTGHAFWPDMPTDREQYGDIIDYHNVGFSTLAGNWDKLIQLQKEGSKDNKFLALPSYEWHSMKYGDHNLYVPGPDMDLCDQPDLPMLREMMAKAGGFAIPHHIGYAAGYRGINWKHFKEDVSPFVEIFSLHGCSCDEYSPYPMLHDMGPRDWGSTAEAGWSMGHKFGIVGGTDHHAAYPGSHGDGRMGVFAESLTRESLFKAFKERRVYAATGDKIDARMYIDDAFVGDVIKNGGKRKVKIKVQSMDALDQVYVIKNGRIIKRIIPTTHSRCSSGKYRLRVYWGWGKNSERHDWNANLQLTNGCIEQVEPCFSGQAVVAPNTNGVNNHKEALLPHEIVSTDDKLCTWKSITSGNITMRHPTVQSVSMLIDSNIDGNVTLDVNGHKIEHKLEDLLHKGRSHYMRGWLSEAVRFGPLVPIEDCVAEMEFEDEPENDTDVYRLQVSQFNGQQAWLSPIWVER